MKKILLIGFIISLFVLSLVSAAERIYFPLPINGQLIGDNVGNQQIKITNQRTGIVEVVNTVSNGQYLYDWSNSDAGVIKYFPDDVFSVEISICSGISSKCKKTITYTGQTELYLTFDLNDIISCPAPITCPPCSGGGGGGGGGCYIPPANCTVPVIPVCTPEQCVDTICNSVIPPDTCDPAVICDSCDACDDVPSEPEEGGIVGIILGFLASLGLGIGGGVYFTKGRILNKRVRIKIIGDRMEHAHPGLKGYHDPKTRHRDEWERHKVGEINPKYEKNEDTDRYEYIGGD